MSSLEAALVGEGASLAVTAALLWALLERGPRWHRLLRALLTIDAYLFVAWMLAVCAVLAWSVLTRALR